MDADSPFVPGDPAPPTSFDGQVVFIHVADAAGEPVRALDAATAITGKGLDGDRYAAGTGHWSPIRRRGDQLTLVEIEELESVAIAHGLRLPPGATRRNITTRGVRLDGLVGQRFRIGDAECLGTRRCEPCSYLDDLLGQDVLPALIHRAGIRAEVTKGGRIAIGDQVQVLPD